MPLAYRRAFECLDSRYITINPFPLLSTLPHLRVVKLHRVRWLPSIEDPCPFSVLPNLLERLDFTSLPFCQPSTAERSLNFLSFNYRDAFPSLRRLKLELDFKCVTAFPCVVPQLPSSLTYLSLENCFDGAKVLGYIAGLVDTEGLAPHSSESTLEQLAASTLPRLTTPLPHLAVLEIATQYMHVLPPLNLVPPSLVHFRWSSYGTYSAHEESEFAEYDISTDPSDPHTSIHRKQTTTTSTESPSGEENDKSWIDAPGACLRSVNLTKSNSASNDWLEALPNHLTSIFFSSYSGDHVYPTLPPRTPALQRCFFNCIEHFETDVYDKIVQSGAKLTYLKTESLPQYSDNFELYEALMSSLTALDLDCLPANLALPSQLKTLRVCSFEEPLTADEIDAFPQGLTELSMDDLIPARLVPHLSRSLKRLSLRLCDERMVKRTNPLIDVNGVPFDCNLLNEFILTDLPPTLEFLVYAGTAKHIDITFGRFLPRSLRFFSSRDTIRLLDPDASYVTKLTGIYGRPEKELVLEAIGFFPPGCICKVGFTPNRMPRDYNIAQLKDIIYMEPVPNDGNN